MSDDALPTPTWQERVGGRWALSWQSYLIGVALNVPLLAVTGGQIGADEVPLSDVGLWTLLGIACSIAVGVYALIADRTFLRHRRSVPVAWWVAAAFHFGVGLIFGLGIVFIGDRLIAPSAQSGVLRVLMVGGIGLWWGLTMSLLLEARSRFEEQHRALLEEAVQLEMTSISESEAAMRLKATVADEVGPAIETTRQRVDEVLDGLETRPGGLISMDDWWSISASLRDTAESTVRPLSQQLWRATERMYPRPRFGRVLSRLVLYQKFAPRITFVIVVVGYLPAGVFEFGLLGGLVATLVLAGVIVGLLAAANVIMRSAPRWHALVFVATLVIALLTTLGYLEFLKELQALRFSLPTSLAFTTEALGSLLGTAIAVIAPAGVASLDAARADVLARFRMDTDRQQVQQLANARQMAALTRSAARELHGTLQTRLVACAAAIEQASRLQDVEQFRIALQMSIAILDSPILDADEPVSSTVGEEITRACAPWDGLCEFRVTVEREVAMVTGVAATSVGRVLEEAIGNACRHGRATSIDIDVTRRDDGCLRVTVDDDGCGPSEVVPGLGTTMLRTISRDRVALSARTDRSGARLVVDVPMSDDRRD